jgi:hypothetical protein
VNEQYGKGGERIHFTEGINAAQPTHSALIANLREPQTYAEAINDSDHALEWKAAMESEYESLIKNDTWEVATLPPGRKAIGSKWIYRVKYDSLGKVTKFKARLVAKGYSQIEGIDYGEIFSPVAKYDSIRMILAIAASKNMLIHQMDVKTAFLNGILKEEVYLIPPPGYELPNGQVYHLCRTLYGLKQSPHEWYSTIDNFFQQNKYSRINADFCVYTSLDKQVIIILYVDDLIITGPSEESIVAVKDLLKSQYEMTDLGAVNWILGMEVICNKDSLAISQALYVTKVLEKFGMIDSNPVKSPLNASVRLHKAVDGETRHDPKSYQQVIGSLMFAMICTRPDIAFAVCSLSQYNADPSEHHWQAVKHVLHYLNGTKDLAIHYKIGSDLNLIGYSDSDWGTNVDN